MPIWTTRRLLIIFAVTMLPRTILAAAQGVTGQPEWWEYDVIAASIAAGQGHAYTRRGFTYLAYAPPLWSYILALLLKLPGDTRVAVQALQACFCFATAILQGTLTGRMTGSRNVGFLSGLLVALQPSLLYYSTVKSDPLPLNVLLLSLIFWAGLRLVDRPSLGRAGGFGLLLATGVLARGTPIVALPLIGLALRRKWRIGAAMTWMGVSIAALCLGLSPWLIRNQQLLGRSLITTTAGENFWRGNHRGATGGVVDENGGRITTLNPENGDLPETVRSVLRSGSEVDRQDIFMNEGLSFVLSEPASAMRLFGRKLTTFWWRIDSDPERYSPAISAAYEITYRLELALALLGGWLVYRRRRDLIRVDTMVATLAIGLMLAISLLQSAFYVQGRHRFLIEPLLLMFTATGAMWVGRQVAPRHLAEA